jgi:hypothetical protein
MGVVASKGAAETTHNNRGDAGGGVFYAVRPEAGSHYIYIYRTYRFPGRKGETAVAVRKIITQNHVDLPSLTSIEVTGLCILLGNNEVLLAAAYNSPGHA